jgi:DNA polymerase sigma
MSREDEAAELNEIIRKRKAAEQEEENPTDVKGQVHKKLVSLTVDLLPELGSADAVRAFFESVLKAAQTKYAEEHSSEIFAAFAKALPNAVQVSKEELARKQRILDSLRDLDK